MQDVRELEGAPQPGRYYWVPVARYWYGRRLLDDWPVIGPRHTDVAFFQFADPHYHIDVRFLTARQRRAMVPQFMAETQSVIVSDAQRRPLSQPHRNDGRPEPGWPALPDPVMRRRRCWIAGYAWIFNDVSSVIELRRAYASQRVRRRDGRMICPHKGAPLDGQPLDADGCLTCPLHGLRIDPAAGRVLPVDDPRAGLAEPGGVAQ